MSIGYLLIGFLFLANPVIHILDIFPDCIGYFFIIKGLTKTAFFVDRIAESRRIFWKLALIDIIKVFAIGFWPFVSDSGLLLMTFVFSLLELLYFIPAITNLFEGMQFAALWYLNS